MSSRPQSRLQILLVFLIAWAAIGLQGNGSERSELEPGERQQQVKATAAAIDALLADYWKASNIPTTEPADDAALLRRASLDLLGRIPTVRELDEFASDTQPDRRARMLDRLVASDEFALHMARVVDSWVQQRQAGDDAFVGWLRQSLAERRGWDAMFRAMLVGPWDQEAEKPAAKFLSKRVKNLDALTADSASAFFGVDISCARCHDHPLVDQWKQSHYYGLAAFFGRTKEDKKAPGQVAEKNDGEVTYAAGGKQETATIMFLTGRKFESVPKANRREQLVSTALDERAMFSGAAVNRLWAWFFGRGLVHPVDQMHTANPPSVPGLLERLADDFAEQGYDLRFLSSAIVHSQAYQMSSRLMDTAATPPPDDAFSVARLRPLSREQYALSIELALGDESFAAAIDDAARREAYLAAEKRGAVWRTQLDPAGAPHQASAAEALFLSNHATLLQLVSPSGENLAARLSRVSDDEQLIAEAFRSVVGRDPTAAERSALLPTLKERDQRASSVAVLLWALVTSAEFRFNH